MIEEKKETGNLSCRKCNRSDKTKDDFYYNKSGKAIMPCKACKKSYYQAWLERNRGYHQKWKKSNPDRVREHNRNYQAKLKEKSRMEEN